MCNLISDFYLYNINYFLNNIKNPFYHLNEKFKHKNKIFNNILNKKNIYQNIILITIK
jgi:hypothetical protein